MRKKVTVAYDGSNYFGYQTQANVKSIQEILEQAVSEINKTKTGITASGRTDRGVHATGQIFHFDTEVNMTEEQWIKAINSHLPLDIRILKVESVNDDFHARYDVLGKKYDYYLNMGTYNLFQRNYVTQLNQKLDVEEMKDCIDVFLGTFDFSSFSGNSFEETPNQIRTITRLEILEEEEILHFVFEGDGFLRYMIRMIVGALIEVGKHRITKEDVLSIRNACSKDACRYKARAEGLYLSEVKYRPK